MNGQAHVWTWVSRGSALLLLTALAACSSKVRNNAPVEDRGTSARPQASAPVSDGVPSGVRMPPGFENAGRPGFYTVKPGDTLIRIALDAGQSWRDLAAWNALENPNRIEVGQVLRVLPPVAGTPAPVAQASSTAPVAAAAPTAVTRPVTSGSATPAGNVPPAGTTATAPPSTAPAAPSSPAAAPTPPAATASAPARPATAGNPPASADEDPPWLWPASGTVVGTFDEARNKGVDISGKLGDPVVAAADGRVVYAGAGLRGYGNLVIIKHNNTYLTAYAHNQTLLVREEQTVRRGQKIAEMGNTDADRVKLHFEIRRMGSPVDPMRYLPAR